MKISIIILHYKNVQDTLDCLRSIGKQVFNHDNIEVILVDNDEEPLLNSRISELKRLEKNITILTPINNLGFAQGVNLGLNKALANNKKTDYFLILNNDTVLPSDALSKLVQNNADIVSPVLKFKNLQGEWVYDYGGKINWWTGRTTHVEKKATGNRQQATDYEIDYVSGCCMMVKRKVLETIGLLDERFFFYFEDVDFCLQAGKQGFKMKVDENVIVYHKLSRSIGRWSKRAIMYNLISNFQFIRKNSGIRQITGLIYLFFLTLKIIYNRLGRNR